MRWVAHPLRCKTVLWQDAGAPCDAKGGGLTHYATHHHSSVPHPSLTAKYVFSVFVLDSEPRA